RSQPDVAVRHGRREAACDFERLERLGECVTGRGHGREAVVNGETYVASDQAFDVTVDVAHRHRHDLEVLTKRAGGADDGVSERFEHGLTNLSNRRQVALTFGPLGRLANGTLRQCGERRGQTPTYDL